MAVVARLRATPVKGLAQTERESLTLVPGGIVDDRRFVVATEDDRVLYSTGLEPLATATASWQPGPDPCAVDGDANGTLELRLPGGTVSGEVVLGAAVAGRAYADRPVPGRVVAGPFATALSDAVGRPLRLLFVAVGVGSPGPLTLLGDGSIERLAGLLGVSGLDPRRFRTSIELGGTAAHEEDTWDGCEVALGGATVSVAGQVPRCDLTTRHPDTRVRDHDVLRTLLAHRSPMAGGEPPLGMYATVVAPGTVRRGDIVRVLR